MRQPKVAQRDIRAGVKIGRVLVICQPTAPVKSKAPPVFVGELLEQVRRLGGSN